MAKFRTMKDVIDETLQYIVDRKEGKIKSLRTGYKKLDKSMIDGIEWNSTLTIGGRPSVGKSAYSDCLVEGCFANNLGEDGFPDFEVLDFNWELSARVMLLRRLSAAMKKTYKSIISADGTELGDDDLQEIMDILTERYGHLPVTFCEEPLTVREFVDTVRRFRDGVVKRGKKGLLVRVDHTLLTRQAASEGSQVQMLLNLLMESNSVKKEEFPIIFMFLTQINREIEERQEDGTDRAFPRQGDVYGGDASAMFSETILLLNKPSKYGINFYGNRGTGMVIEPNDLFAHMVKNRNAEGDLILHYKENFKHMSIKEV
jgi:replicative DNA helicase